MCAACSPGPEITDPDGFERWNVTGSAQNSTQPIATASTAPPATANAGPGNVVPAATTSQSAVETTTANGNPTAVNPVPGPAAQPVPAGPSMPNWSMFGYDLGNSRNNRSETALSVATVAKLEKRWTVPAGPGSGGITSSPIVVGDTLYVCEHPGALAAYAAHTGMLKWRRGNLGSVRCGTPLVTEDRIYVSVGSALQAFKLDGTPIWSKVYGVRLPLTDGSPIPAGDRIVVGVGTYEVINSPPYSAKGIIVAFEKDGTEAWRIVPAGDMTTGISVWSSAAVDEKRHTLYIGTGQAYQQPAGPNSDAIMAIDYTNGAVTWVNQFHEGDNFTNATGGRDWDIGAAPNLLVINGVDAVGAGSKGGLYRTIERDTGKTIWDRDLGNPGAVGGIMTAAAVADGRIFLAHRMTGSIGGGTSELTALNVADGTDAWPMPIAMPAYTWGAITHANGVVYSSIQNGAVFAFDATSGAQLWTTTLANGAAGGPTVSAGWLYVPTGYTGLGPNTRGADLNGFSLDDGSGPVMPPPGPGSGTAGAGGGPMGGAAFAKIVDVLANNHGCIGGFCHGESGGLNLQASLPDQYAALLGSDRKGAPTGDATTTGMCGGKKRVVPGDPTMSVLYQKISSMVTCGDVMPPGGSSIELLSAAEIETVRAWIAAGAPYD